MFTSTCWYPASSELPNERWTKAVETPRKVQPRVNHILGHGSIMDRSLAVSKLGIQKEKSTQLQPWVFICFYKHQEWDFDPPQLELTCKRPSELLNHCQSID
jgi:hypothetical protein